MSAALTTPPPPASPQPLRITAAQFNQMGDMGWFEGRRAFLLDGVILEQGPMNTPHATGLALAGDALRAVFPTGWVVRSQSPLRVDEFNDPFPDLAVVPGGPRDYLAAHPTTAALVVGVSDTTSRTDLTDKAERCAAAGIPEYWVLDVDGRELLVFRDPAQPPARPTPSRPLAAPAATTTVADLLL